MGSTTITIISWFRRRTIRRVVSMKGGVVRVWGTFTRTRVIFRRATRGIGVVICAWRWVWFVGIMIVMFVISRSITIVIGRICSRRCFSIVARTGMWTWKRTRLISSVARRSAGRVTITSTTVARIRSFIWRIFKMLIKSRSWRSGLRFWFFEHIETTKASWYSVVIFMAKGTILFELRFWFIVRVYYLNLWRFWRRFLDICILLERIGELNNFKRKFLSFNFSSVISSESTILTREWKGIDGSKEFEICLTWRLLAKSFNFLGRPRVKISLHFRLIVEGYSLYQPCFTRVSTLRAKWRTFSLSFLTRERASICAWYACFWE